MVIMCDASGKFSRVVCVVRDTSKGEALREALGKTAEVTGTEVTTPLCDLTEPGWLVCRGWFAFLCAFQALGIISTAVM